MADADLTQYDVTAATANTANTENALTGALLCATDGKKITADANTSGKAPVNKSIKKLADRIAGLRGWIVGNVTGVNPRSLKSMLIDATGGTAHTEAAGTAKIKSDTGVLTIQNVADTLRALLGTNGLDLINTAGSTFNLRTTYGSWVNTSAGGANPAKTVAYANTLNPLILPKYWVYFQTDGAGAITYSDGAHGCTLALPGGSAVQVTFPSNFDAAGTYGVLVTASQTIAGGAAVAEVPLANKQQGSCLVKFNVDPAAVRVDGTIVIWGRQTT